MRIGTREIGRDHPPYIIAELGVNHDGDPKRALELVRLAAEAGADAIKLQLFEADRLMSKAAKLAAYQKAAGESDPVEMLRRLELSIDDMAPCVSLAHELNIHAIVSVFSVELVPVAETLPWDAYKTASPDIINKPLLDALAATGKPLIVSTGASTLDEVKRAVAWLTPIHERLAVLQCVSCYPVPIEHAELGAIKALAELFSGVVGYSDHTEKDFVAGLAVALDAEILEKHFTKDRSAQGPDHAASLDPQLFGDYVRYAHTAYEIVSSQTHRGAVPLIRIQRSGAPSGSFRVEAERIAAGNGRELCREKRVLPIEQDVRTVSRQSLTTTRALLAGHILTATDLTIKRPGTGIPPFELDSTIGKRLARTVEADMPLMADDTL